jgi:hypothetical protein
LGPVCVAIGAGAVAVVIAPLLRGLPGRLLVSACVLAVFGLIVKGLVLSTQERSAMHRATRDVSF